MLVKSIHNLFLYFVGFHRGLFSARFCFLCICYPLDKFFVSMDSHFTSMQMTCKCIFLCKRIVKSKQSLCWTVYKKLSYDCP